MVELQILNLMFNNFCSEFINIIIFCIIVVNSVAYCYFKLFIASFKFLTKEKRVDYPPSKDQKIKHSINHLEMMYKTLDERLSILEGKKCACKVSKSVKIKKAVDKK